MLSLALTFARSSASRLIAAGQWLLQNGRWKYALLALGALLSAFLVRDVLHTRKQAKASQEAAQAAQDSNRVLTGAIKSADKAVTTNNAAKAVIRQKEIQGSAQTDAALKANADWSNQPIPADVAASLRD